MTVIPFPELGNEFAVDDASESSPSNETTARLFKPFVMSVGLLAEVDWETLPLKLSPVALPDQLATAAALRTTSGKFGKRPENA